MTGEPDVEYDGCKRLLSRHLKPFTQVAGGHAIHVEFSTGSRLSGLIDLRVPPSRFFPHVRELLEYLRFALP